MKVTVIIPYDKSRGYLQEAIDSVKSQTYTDIELIVEQGYCVWPVSANKAIQKSSGDLIKILAEDDLLTPQSVEHAVGYFSSNAVDFIHSNAINFFEDGREEYWNPSTQKYPGSPLPTFEQNLEENKIHGGSVTYRRRCFEKRLFDETLWTGEEWEFHLWLQKSGYALGYLNEFTGRYRRHSNQKSLGSQSIQRDRHKEFSRIRDKFR
mgnify:CR=1 FL=1